MAVELKRLKKLETPAASDAAALSSTAGRLLVLVKLREGARCPDFVSPRARIAGGILSAEIEAGDLERLEADPAVQSVSVARSLQIID